MGVTGLWTVLQPCARPIKLETLNRKRLAVDASIWIYQFLKAVRDKEGNALRNSHIVGFFRRICKLLFFGIKPVFVFDGGAPALKRQTISSRKARREGRREDAVRTAGKLLALQMQRRAEEEEERRRRVERAPAAAEEEPLPENMVYAEELGMTERERKQNRSFKKKDAYHLPELDAGLVEMGAPNDPRIMSQEELEDYARHFHSGEDINLYDFSKIDFNSPFFQSLPAADRYNILNAARLRSRLRMGYSKEQLDTMFPDRMAFSKFQIERVKERNELTQRLMNLNGMNGDDFINGTQRVAGERGKEYVLVKNEGVEGGWALGVVSSKNEGERNQPIDVESSSALPKAEDEHQWEDEDEFEDVPIEGMNRLPKQPMGRNHNEVHAIQSDEARKARRALYEGRKEAASAPRANPAPVEEEDPDSLFVMDDPQEGIQDDSRFQEDTIPATESDNEELQKAIAMSLEKDDELGDAATSVRRATAMNVPDMKKPLDFNRKNAQTGRAFAQLANGAAQSSLTRPAFENAFADSTARRLSPSPQERLASASKPKPAANSGFSGPLPFEALSLGGSFLRRKKKPEDEGGFEKEDTPQPLPPWFSGDVRDGNAKQKALDIQEEESEKSDGQHDVEESLEDAIARPRPTKELIDLDEQPQSQLEKHVIEVDLSSSDSDDIEMGDVRQIQQKPIELDADLQMNDVADAIRADPPKSSMPAEHRRPVSESQLSEAGKQPAVAETDPASHNFGKAPALASQHSVEDEEQVDWSDSDAEGAREAAHKAKLPTPKAPSQQPPSAHSSPEPDFEDVDIAAAPGASDAQPSASNIRSSPQETSRRAPSEPLPEIDLREVELADEYSDPEDEELLRNLATEAEEHARFAASLSHASEPLSAESYEREFRQLRSQQAKDRRDADEVTSIMIGECQQLLRLFGLPYISAPMEAEAQCAELVHLGLVDGIVTDDSDIFLFGGTRVYKNMFNQAKFVECYLSTDLEREYSLTREKIIQIAHLLGSDYTEGLPGIGPVTALEILSEFEDLEAFKQWWTTVQSSLAEPVSTTKAKMTPFQKKFRKNATKLFLPPTFPDARVQEAYLFPDVDSDDTPFQWGVPDLDALRAFLMQTVGWSRERADEILVPVVRDMNQRQKEGTQSNITKFFAGTVGAGAARMRGLGVDHASRSSKGGGGGEGGEGRGSGGGGRGGEGGGRGGEERGSGGGGGGREDDPTATDTASSAAVAAEGFAPRRKVAGSKRMENALGRLHAQATRRTRASAADGVAEDNHDGDDDGGEGNDEQPERPKKARKRKR